MTRRFKCFILNLEALPLAMKRLVKQLARNAGYEIRPISAPQSIKDQNPDVAEREWQIFSLVKDKTMLSLERVLANIRAVDYVIQNAIPGDIVECGVWRGGSSMAMALALGHHRRTLWMYDTFSGMTDATEHDRTNSGIQASELLDAAHRLEKRENSLVIAFASLEDVQANMKTTQYPEHLIKYIQGQVEKTIPGEMPEQIALLRIDTDWYESTKHELVHLFPRLSRGGVLIIDDYGHWQGARKAVDEYFGGKLFLNRIDYTGRLAIKA